MSKLVIKSITLLAAMVLVFGISAAASADAPVTVYVNGTKLASDVDPIIENGRTLVPMRAIFEALGADVEWTDETKTATATKGNVTIEIAAGSSLMHKNGGSISLDVGAKIVGSRMLVPARAVSEGLDAKVEWHETKRRVVIVSSGALSFKTLSDADMAAFLARASDLRSHFEQQLLFDMIYASRMQYASDIRGGNRATVDYVSGVWDAMITESIMNIQSQSDTLYIVNEYENLTDSQLESAYIAIAKSAKLSSDDVISTAFVTTSASNKGVLVSFANADKKDNCSLIAVMAQGDSVRYFTAEALQDGQKLCNVYEISGGAKKSCNLTVGDADAFLTVIDMQMKK